MIAKEKYPFLYWGWRIALPYNVCCWILGIIVKLDFLPDFLGSLRHPLVFFFTPGMAPILTFEYNGLSDVFWLIIKMASILFLIWIFISPIFGMFRLLIGLKN